jgi:hypothetical protein
MKKDYSKEIYDTYFNKKERIVKVVLNDGTELEGIFVSFFHGDQEGNDTFIVKWHFIEKEDIPKYKRGIPIDGDSEIGIIIHQKDIKVVTFI